MGSLGSKLSRLLVRVTLPGLAHFARAGPLGLAGVLPGLGPAEDGLLLHGVGQLVHGVLDGARKQLQSGAGGGLLWKLRGMKQRINKGILQNRRGDEKQI